MPIEATFQERFPGCLYFTAISRTVVFKLFFFIILAWNYRGSMILQGLSRSWSARSFPWWYMRLVLPGKGYVKINQLMKDVYAPLESNDLLCPVIIWKDINLKHLLQNLPVPYPYEMSNDPSLRICRTIISNPNSPLRSPTCEFSRVVTSQYDSWSGQQLCPILYHQMPGE